MEENKDTCSALARPLPELYADIRSGVAVISKVYPTPNCIAEPFEGEVIRIGGEQTVEGFAYKVISEEQRNLINGLVKCANAYPKLVEALKAVQSELAQMSGRMSWIASHLEDAGGSGIDVRDLRDTKRQCSDAYFAISAALREAGER